MTRVCLLTISVVLMMTSGSLSVELVHTLRGHTSDVNTVLFSSSFLASCSSDKTIRLWNLDDQSSTALTRHTYQVHCLAFAALDGQTSVKYMASVSTDGTCLLWDLKSISVLKEYRHESGSPIRVCQFSADGLLLATGERFSSLSVFEGILLLLSR